ncbi:hypothetical protein Tco_0689746 [Tanacetum coccineum]
MATNEETYDQPLAMTTTNIFEVNHEDAYDSDVDEGPNAAAVFMANLSSTSATNDPVNERNKRNAELVQENDLLKVTLSGKEKSIAFLQSEKEKILSEKEKLADSYLG